QRRLVVFASGVHGLPASERFHCAGDAIFAAARRTITASHSPISASVRGRPARVPPPAVCALARFAALRMLAITNTATRAFIFTPPWKRRPLAAPTVLLGP